MDVTVVSGVGPEKGLGAQLSIRFAQEGMHVFVSGRTKAKLDHVVELIQKKGGPLRPLLQMQPTNPKQSSYSKLLRQEVISNSPSTTLETIRQGKSSTWKHPTSKKVGESVVSVVSCSQEKP